MGKLFNTILVIMMVSGCKNTEKEQDTCVPKNAIFLPIKDGRTLPQKGWDVLTKSPLADGAPLFSDYSHFKKDWSRSWSEKALSFTHKNMTQWHDTLRSTWFGSNFHPCSPDWLQGVKDNAHLDVLNTVAQPGIITAHTSLRTLPTDHPLYRPVSQDFVGVPFDRLQNSYLQAGTPVYISHWTKDRAWALVQDANSVAIGFVPVSNLALMNDGAFNQLRDLSVGVFLQDNHPLYDEKGLFLGQTRLGMVLFVDGQDERGITVLWPRRDDAGMVRFHRVHVAKNRVTIKPLEWEKSSLAVILDQLLGRPYGWGGALGNRDCSAMVQDYFRLFGLALPRNSLGQIEYQQGTFTDLSGLSDQEKQRIIMQKGIPYRTILYCRGHIGLYVGALAGRPLMMHALWSIGLDSHRGIERANVVGASLVSYLDYGKELQGVNKKKLFIKRLCGMRVF